MYIQVSKVLIRLSISIVCKLGTGLPSTASYRFHSVLLSATKPASGCYQYLKVPYPATWNKINNDLIEKNRVPYSGLWQSCDLEQVGAGFEKKVE